MLVPLDGNALSSNNRHPERSEAKSRDLFMVAGIP
jgi:hypothetical protein